MQKRVYFTYYINVLVGLAFILFTSTLLFKAFKISGFTVNESSSNKYYYGIFSNVSGIKENDAVFLMGVKVGKVKTITLDVENLNVVMKIAVDKSINIPSDSSLSISSKGLLDGKAVTISPGVDDDFLKNESYFQSTSSAFNLEELASKLINKFTS